MPGARLTVRESEVAAEEDEGVERKKESLEWGSCPSSTVKGPFQNTPLAPVEDNGRDLAQGRLCL